MIGEDFRQEGAEKGTEKRTGIWNLSVGKGGVEEDKQLPVDNQVSLLLLCEGTSTRFELLTSLTELTTDNQ